MSEPPSESPRPWPHHGSEHGPDLMVGRVRFDRLENPRTGATHRRFVLETPNWVNVVAFTPEDRLVVVRQYRFGTREVTTEIPGGMIDPGEEPLAAAKREPREETGYTSERWSALGSVTPNPAFLDNRCYHFLAEDCRRTHELELDPGEDIVVGTLSRAEVRAEIDAGTVDHSLVIAALARVMDLSPRSSGTP